MQNTTNRSSDGELQTFESLLDKKLEVARIEFNSLKNRLDDLERQADLEGGHGYGEDVKTMKIGNLLPVCMSGKPKKSMTSNWHLPVSHIVLLV